jgi:hypothetical protein
VSVSRSMRDFGTDEPSNVMRKILAKVPVDPTLVDDAIQSSLCSGDIVKVSRDELRVRF